MIRTMEVTLFGGPMDGERVTLPASAEKFTVGRGAPFFTYTYAGKQDAKTIFAIRLKSRKANRTLFSLIGQLGRDPRIEAVFAKRKPVVGGQRMTRGKAAARRAVRRRINEEASRGELG